MKRLKHILTATSLVWIAFPVAAADLPKTTHLDASCLVSVWSPSSRAIAEDKYWRPEVNLNRLSFAKPAPSEDGNALAIQAENGIPGEMVSLKRTNGFAKQHAPAIGRIRADIYFDSVDGFNIAAAKLPLGLWGGELGTKFCGAGLCPPDEQTGFSVRLTRSRLDLDDRWPPILQTFRIYSYHINRPGEVLERPSKDGKGTRRTLKGSGIVMHQPLKAGVWYQVILDVGLNSFDGDQPVADGWTDIYLLDEDGTILDWAGETGLIYRKSPNWSILGPYLVDLWGGDPKKQQNLPLSDLLTYFEDYELLFLDPEKSADDCRAPM